MKTPKRIVLLILIVSVFLAFTSWVRASSFPTSPIDDSPLTQCYQRCRGSLLLNFDWCAGACRCSLGYEDCSERYVPWHPDDRWTKEARAEIEVQ